MLYVFSLLLLSSRPYTHTRTFAHRQQYDTIASSTGDKRFVHLCSVSARHMHLLTFSIDERNNNSVITMYSVFIKSMARIYGFVTMLNSSFFRFFAGVCENVRGTNFYSIKINNNNIQLWAEITWQIYFCFHDLCAVNQRFIRCVRSIYVGFFDTGCLTHCSPTKPKWNHFEAFVDNTKWSKILFHWFRPLSLVFGPTIFISWIPSGWINFVISNQRLGYENIVSKCPISQWMILSAYSCFLF